MGFKRACDEAYKQYGISSKLIMCLLRHLEPKDCLATIEEAKPYIENGVISGLALDSAEKPFPPNLFIKCYGQVASINPDLRLTAHAGKEGPAQYVTNFLDLLSVTRIDYGINSANDDELLKRLAQEKIMLTVCPLSNVKVQVVKAIHELPLQRFLDINVPFSINFDDPSYFGGYILDNFIQVAKDFPHWNYNIWGRVAENAINGTWCDDKGKNELLTKVDEVVSKYL